MLLIQSSTGNVYAALLIAQQAIKNHVKVDVFSMKFLVQAQHCRSAYCPENVSRWHQLGNASATTLLRYMLLIFVFWLMLG